MASPPIRHILFLFAVSGLTFFTRLGAPALWDRDEPRNAGCTLEMMARGDWVVPMFNGELRTHKPVLLYWLMMPAYRVFRDPEFAARFWSAALGVGTVLMTYFIGRRLFNATAGLWAGIILSTTILFTLVARAATPESLFVFCLTAAKLTYVVGAFKPKDAEVERPVPTEPRGRPWGDGRYFVAWPFAAAMYALMGLAVLAKGPAGLVLPTATIGMFLLLMRQPGPAPRVTESSLLRRLAAPFAPAHFLRTAWSMRPITALLVASAVALPWYALVWHRTDGAWVRGFILEHNLGRIHHAHADIHRLGIRGLRDDRTKGTRTCRAHCGNQNFTTGFEFHGSPAFNHCSLLIQFGHPLEKFIQQLLGH